MEKLLKVSEKATVFIHATCYMSLKEQGEFSSVREIADAISAPRVYLSKILQPMVSKGLLLSLRGVRGGFYISAEARKLSLLDLLIAVDGEFDVNSCIFSKPICFNYPCILSKLNQDIKKMAEDRLSAITLTEFAKITFPK